jgi:hypothetical protein
LTSVSASSWKWPASLGSSMASLPISRVDRFERAVEARDER